MSEEKTHLKDTTDLIQTLHPGSDHLLILLLVEELGDRTPLAPLDYVLLDVGHDPAIENSVSTSSDVYVARSTHVVNCPIPTMID